MPKRSELSGKYRILNWSRLQEKAKADDPRQIFYRTLLELNSYESYLSKVGELKVEVPTYKAGLINGRMEILYCRRNHWIEDATEN